MSDIISAQHHRHFYLLEGDLESCLDYFLSLSQHLESPLLVASDPLVFQSASGVLKSAKQSPLILPTSKLKQQLGQSHEAVFIDLENGLSANAISLIAGTIKGGGVLALSLRDISQWLNNVDIEQARYLPWPLTPTEALPYFKQYFLDKLSHSNIQHITASCLQINPTSLNRLQKSTEIIVPTSEQTILIEEIKTFARLPQHEAQALHSARLVIAHRGRGKSTALGLALAQLSRQQTSLRFAITGPNKAALAQLENSYHNAITTSADAALFFAPDSLIQTPLPIDLLLVDEAAALPLPMLKALYKHYPKVIFSSTDHGYEGAGKGFGTKFTDYLKDNSQSFKQLSLNEPIRWLAGDKLEAFIDELLLLKNNKRQHYEDTAESPLEIHPIQYGGWLQDQTLLANCFSLLVSAHYQTSPDDIRWILDDPSVSTWVMKQQEQVVSTAILTQEGQLDSSLAQEVAHGTRRPRGHLLPQSLLAHEGHLDAGEYRYWRISRIASQRQHQNVGHASQLLKQISIAAQQANIDFLCTSFAATCQVLNFWQKNGFHCIRLGTTRDQASGCYSVMMIKALNPAAQLKAQSYQAHYLSNAKLNLNRDYLDIEPRLAQLLLAVSLEVGVKNKHEFNVIEKRKDIQDLTLFAHHHRPYDTIRAQLYRRFITCQSELTERDNANQSEVNLLREAAMKPRKEADFSAFNLNSKKAIDKALRFAVAQHLID